MNDLATSDIAATAPATVRPERRRAPRLPATHVRVWVTVAATIGLTVTVLVSATNLVAFAYKNVPLHVAVEITAAMASILAAQLVHGRFRSTLQPCDLALFTSLVGFAATNLLFSALPLLGSTAPSSFRTWAPLVGSFVSTALLAVAPFLGDHVVRRPDLAVRRVMIGCAGGLAIIALVVAAAGDALPAAIEPSARAIASDGPAYDGSVGLIGAQLLSVILFAAAAAGFSGRAHRHGDVLAAWLAVAATLGAFARLSYALFPSLYTQWFSGGDALRLGCFVAVFAGAVGETRRLQRALAQSAVVDERHRIARELHDGVSQDLAYIVQQLRRLAGTEHRPSGIDVLVRAAERALDESRHAVAALSRATDRPLDEALASAAREAGEREGSVVFTDLAAGVTVPPRAQQELLRVVREAVINAARHGQARYIRVHLRAGPHLSIVIGDDGRGFDTSASLDGHYGLESMRARVRSIGGELSITSAPGTGTEVRIDLP
jgi:signal transduction histidine kinase